MHDVGDGVLLDDAQHGVFVAQIHLFKNVFRVSGNLFQIFQMPGVGQAIQIDQPLDFRPVDDMMDQVGADKASAASDEQFHGLSRTCRRLVSQFGRCNPKVFCNLLQSRAENAGRFAGVG